ncbi:MAG: PP2C family protein-serine/threonine phosphatase [Acidobacteria bacterium]|nr:PP2C family protein-serine/threonine phosphatase [Acidobacteriota bacterium]
MDVRQRFEKFAGRFSEAGRGGGTGPAALKEDYWKSVSDLFTKDITGKAMLDFLQHEPGETYRFFTREVDLAALRPLPWHRKYPAGAWRVFLAMAYRLSPPRRVLFAVAVPILMVFGIRYLLKSVSATLEPGVMLKSPSWLLVSATILFILLVLELRDKLALKGDLEVARQIQFGLLPFEPYCKEGISIDCSMRPANTVGGDYFDIVELAEGRLAVILGDVAGKGMPAALLMALLQGSLRTLLTAGHRGAELMEKLNVHLDSNIPSNRLITLFYGELDLATGALRYVNSGHNPPFLVRSNGTVERLQPTDVALGVVPSVTFHPADVQLAPGDRLLLFTDGLTEAFNTQEKEYGEERLETFLRAHGSIPQREMLDKLLADVQTFCGAARQRDDMTLMSISRE